MIRKKVGGKFYDMKNLDAELLRVGRLWKRNARAKLQRDNKNATGTLTKSMKVRTGSERGNAFVDLTPSAPYWQFVDLGVRGAGPMTDYDRSKGYPFPRQEESPFRFRNKWPPIPKIEKWIKVKGIQGRDNKGRFISHKSFAFLISRAIFRRGIKPTFFISDTGERIERKYAASIAQAFADDLAVILQNRTQ